MNGFIRYGPVAFFAIAFVLDFLGKIEVLAVFENAHLGVLSVVTDEWSVALETLVQDDAYYSTNRSGHHTDLLG